LGKNVQVLVVEDNPKNLRLVNDILESQGYSILKAETGEEGLKKARDKNPDLIIMDIQMADYDGLLVTKILKENDVTAQIPIIALTAMAMKGDREKIIQAGCDDYLSKPFRYDHLIETVRKWAPNISS